MITTTRGLLTLMSLVHALLAVVAIDEAYSATIYSNLGPNDSFSANNVFAVNGPTAQPFFTRLDQAAQFTATSSFTLASTDIPLALDTPIATGNGFNAANVSLFPDVNGLPGSTVIDTVHIQDVLSRTPALFTVVWPHQPLLNAGSSYWLAISAGSSSASLYWMGNSLSLHTPEAVNVNQTGWQAETSTIGTMAFRMSGTPVPEPSLFVLGITGLAGLGITLRKKFLRAKQAAAP